MRKILMVVRREYLERVTKKSFWIGTAVFPLIMVGLIFFQFALFLVKTGEQRRIALVDATGAVFQAFDAKLADQKLKDGRREFLLEDVPVHGDIETTRKSLEGRVAEGDLYGIISVGPDPDAKDAFRFYGKNVGNIMVIEKLEGALRHAVIGLRLDRSQVSLDRKTLERIIAPVDFETFQVSATGETRKKAFLQAYLGTFAFVMILYMSLLLYGIATMRGILEEKSNRVMEVLLGSLTPNELMTGKIVGIGLVGLTQIAVYAVTAGAVRVYVAASQLQADWTVMLEGFSVGKLVYFLLYFVLGYFLYTALFAAIGAICNTEQEAQNLQTGVVMCLVLPMVATFFFVGNPDSTAAMVVSLIPLFTPMVMFMRISTVAPPFWQIALSLVLMGAAIWFVFRGVAKVFRIGILMYGKRPTIPEVLRWVRT